MPLTAYGPCAVSYAGRLPNELDLLVFDEFGFAEALDNALERAYHSGPFLSAPIISDRRSKVALEAVSEIVTQRSAYWRRRQYLEQIRERHYLFANGATQIEREALTKKERDSMADVLLASDGIVVRSWAELVRLSQLLDYRPIRTRRSVAPITDPIPDFSARRGARSIIVWAPCLDASRAAIFAAALEELNVPVIIACTDAQSGAAFGLRAQFVEWNSSAQLGAHLEDAAALIDAATDDPAWTVELAALGLPVAANFTSGAYEFVDGLYLYDVWDFRSILHVALSALGGEPPQPRTSTPRPSDLIDDPPRLSPPVVDDPPLVSIIITTLDRHGILPRAIDSIACQTYPNVETVVVNDGGKSVDSIVARLSRVRVIDNPHPLGGAQALNAVRQMAKGKYIAFLSDDDYIFPTYFSRLVYALERTGENVAAGMCADSYLVPGEDGYYDFIGTSIRPYRSTDPTVLRTIPVSMPTTLVSREAADLLGIFSKRARYYSDYDWVLRLAQRYDFLWTSHLVLNMDTRLDQSNFSRTAPVADRVSDLTHVWAQWPNVDRPDIDAAQEALLELYRSDAPSALHPMHRGVTRLTSARCSVYRLH